MTVSSNACTEPTAGGSSKEQRHSWRATSGCAGTIDIDVYRDVACDAAEADLRDAAAADLGDWFRFEVGPGRAVVDGAPGTRLPVKAYVGATDVGVLPRRPRRVRTPHDR
ncbi:MAG: hypothetical protein KatS3mg010_0458 [Acidimicrobiia bacterium]|nr:MAG: hypothetical protein KatS3mg010_0458 [Acidimicrobiia bacterium]